MNTEQKVDVSLDAIDQIKTLSFVYDGKPRTIEVHAVGNSVKDDSFIVRGYQVAGESSRPLPTWGLFTMNKMTELVIDETDSEAPRKGYKMNDSQMRSIESQIVLEDA